MDRQTAQKMALEMEQVLVAGGDARAAAASLEKDLGKSGFRTARVAFHQHADITARSLVDQVRILGMWESSTEKRSIVEAAWSRALDAASEGLLAPLRTRLNAFTRLWRDRLDQSLPLEEEIAEVIGTDAATVKRLLNEDILEQKPPHG